MFAWVNHIRNLLATEDVSFPKLECLEQVQPKEPVVRQTKRIVRRKKRS
jgi:hypothetical protein